MDEPVTINAWQTVTEAREIGLNTIDPSTFRVVTTTGKLHWVGCDVVDRVSPDNQLFIEDSLFGVEHYLEEKGLEFDDVRCGKCCKPFFVHKGRLHFDYGTIAKIPWTMDLSPEDLKAMYERLAVEHYREIGELRQILTEELLEKRLQIYRAHGEEVSEFDEELHQEVIERLMEALVVISGFMEGERRRVKIQRKYSTEDNHHCHI